MIESPTPQHGFFAVQVAVCAYLAGVVAVVLGLGWFGAPAGAMSIVFVAVAVAVLVPFWPAFRRLHPRH